MPINYHTHIWFLNLIEKSHECWYGEQQQTISFCFTGVLRTVTDWHQSVNLPVAALFVLAEPIINNILIYLNNIIQFSKFCTKAIWLSRS